MKKSLLACTIFPVALLMASAQAAAATITVTTTADQDGNDTANCSLREAIVAVNRSQAYGGCPAGIFRAQNTIQLKSGTYLLDSELMVSQEVTIRGADTFRRIGDGFGTTEGNVLTGSEVSRLQPLTIIKPAVGKNIRLINAAAATSGVELVDLVLEGRDFARITATAGKIQTLAISNVAFGLSREARAKVETEAQTEAIEQFKSRAAELAKGFGFSNYSLREVAVNSNEMVPGPRPRMMAMEAKAGSFSDSAVPVEAGKAQVIVNVSGSVQMR